MSADDITREKCVKLILIHSNLSRYVPALNWAQDGKDPIFKYATEHGYDVRALGGSIHELYPSLLHRAVVDGDMESARMIYPELLRYTACKKRQLSAVVIGAEFALFALGDEDLALMDCNIELKVRMTSKGRSEIGQKYLDAKKSGK
jgi:hypothetical protein